MTMATRIHRKRSPYSSHRAQLEDWQQMLANYRHKALLTFELHRSEGGTCTASGEHWPSDRAIAAEQVLEL